MNLDRFVASILIGLLTGVALGGIIILAVIIAVAR